MPGGERPLDLLLVVCPPWGPDMPPLGLAYLAAMARDRGFSVEIWDLNVELFNQLKEGPLLDFWQIGHQNRLSAEAATARVFQQVPALLPTLAARILARGPALLGFSVHNRNLAFTEALVALVKRPKGPLVVYGGPEVTIRHHQGTLPMLQADVLVIGEGEQTLCDLLATLASGQGLRSIPGLLLPSSPEAFRPRPPLSDLDQLPMPDYRDLDLDRYPAPFSRRHLPLLFSRGCIGHCTFCIDHMISGRLRVRSASATVNEMRLHHERHGVGHFSFNDLVCNGNPLALSRLCDALIEAGLPLTWDSYALCHRRLGRTLLDKMAQAGCRQLTFGLESASDAVLRAMNKTYTADIAQQNLRDCAAAGIHTAVNLIVGFPGEGPDDFEATLAFIRQNRQSIHTVCNLGTCQITHGARLHSHPHEFQLSPDPDHGSWQASGGNTLPERERRLRVTHRLLDELHIPVLVTNREVGATDLPLGDEAFMDPVEGRCRLLDLQFFDESERPVSQVGLAQDLSLCIRFQVMRPVVDPLVRVQLFAQHNLDLQGILLFGTHTDRAGVKLGPLEPGEHRVELRLGSRGLGPGAYRLTVGLWPDEGAATAFEVWHGRRELCVLGEPGDPPEPVRLFGAFWPGRRLGPPRGQPLEGVVLVGDGGQACQRFTSGETLRLHAELNLESQAILALTLLHEGLTLQTLRSPPLGMGRRRVRVELAPLDLLTGTYALGLHLQGEGLADASVQVPFSVESRFEQGGGLLALPHGWIG